jgi:hypothetical protein
MEYKLMNLDEAKKIMKEYYTKTGFELTDEHSEELFMKHNYSDIIVRIGKEELKAFCTFKDNEKEYERKPVECAICSKNYREQMLDFTNSDQRRFFMIREPNLLFGEKNDDSIYVEIGPSSSDFINNFRFDEAYEQMNQFRFRRVNRGRDSREMQDILYRPITIKIFNINESSIENAIKKTNPIIDSCLFTLSYLKNTVLRLEENFPRRYPRSRPFRYKDEDFGNNLPLSKVNFNADIIKFYQRALSTDDPVNQYLAYYQVIEYFFIMVSDEQLYDKLARRINDQKFKTIPRYLDRIIQDMVEHQSITDETEMFKNVLNRFVEEKDIMDFIKEYEVYLGENLYTKKKNIFGLDSEIKLTPNHINGNLSKRIKHIRNCLVHSSDRYERKERYIPSIESEKIISNEIPLLKFIAERVIIATGN